MALKWLRERVEGADIEAVRGDMLERMVVREEKIAVLFYKVVHAVGWVVLRFELAVPFVYFTLGYVQWSEVILCLVSLTTLITL